MKVFVMYAHGYNWNDAIWLDSKTMKAAQQEAAAICKESERGPLEEEIVHYSVKEKQIDPKADTYFSLQI